MQRRRRDVLHQRILVCFSLFSERAYTLYRSIVLIKPNTRYTLLNHDRATYMCIVAEKRTHTHTRTLMLS